MNLTLHLGQAVAMEKTSCTVGLQKCRRGGVIWKCCRELGVKASDSCYPSHDGLVGDVDTTQTMFVHRSCWGSLQAKCDLKVAIAGPNTTVQAHNLCSWQEELGNRLRLREKTVITAWKRL